MVRPLALTSNFISSRPTDFVIIKTSDFWYSWDLIRNDPERAFLRYEDIRKERTSAVVRKSHENREHVFSPDLADSGALANEVVHYWQQQHVRERLDWLYQYDATAIAV